MTEERKSDKGQDEWSQAHTPGSDVELQKLPNAAEEPTTQITEPTDDLAFAETAEAPPVEEGGGAVEDTPTTQLSLDGFYRSADPEAELAARQADLEAAKVQLAEERARFDAERAEAERVAAERAARERQLGIVARTGEQVVAPPAPAKLVTDKFLGSLGLFILRLITAGVLGIRGYQVLTDVASTKAVLAATQLPYPAVMAWVLGIALVVGALMVLLGLAVRVVGISLVAGAGVSLAFLRWGSFSPFVEAMPGLLGEFELLLVGIGVLFACLGGGRWGADGSLRSSRAKAKAAAAE